MQVVDGFFSVQRGGEFFLCGLTREEGGWWIVLCALLFSCSRVCVCVCFVGEGVGCVLSVLGWCLFRCVCIFLVFCV